MSHIVRLKLGIHDLQLLKDTCTRLGLVFNEGITTHKVYYSHQGKCLHMISRLDAQPGDYEIGVVADENGGYALNFDPFVYGQGVPEMLDIIGQDCSTLAKEYLHQAAMNTAEVHGGVVTFEENEKELVYEIELPEEVVVNA